MLQYLRADSKCVLQVNDNTSIILDFIFFFDKLFCPLLLAVNYCIECEILVNG